MDITKTMREAARFPLQGKGAGTRGIRGPGGDSYWIPSGEHIRRNPALFTQYAKLNTTCDAVWFAGYLRGSHHCRRTVTMTTVGDRGPWVT
jgi:hypothetical protein